MGRPRLRGGGAFSSSPSVITEVARFRVFGFGLEGGLLSGGIDLRREAALLFGGMVVNKRTRPNLVRVEYG